MHAVGTRRENYVKYFFPGPDTSPLATNKHLVGFMVRHEANLEYFLNEMFRDAMTKYTTLSPVLVNLSAIRILFINSCYSCACHYPTRPGKATLDSWCGNSTTSSGLVAAYASVEVLEILSSIRAYCEHARKRELKSLNAVLFHHHGKDRDVCVIANADVWWERIREFLPHGFFAPDDRNLFRRAQLHHKHIQQTINGYSGCSTLCGVTDSPERLEEIRVFLDLYFRYGAFGGVYHHLAYVLFLGSTDLGSMLSILLPELVMCIVRLMTR